MENIGVSFLAVAGTPIKHGKQAQALLDALLLPKEWHVFNLEAHTKEQTHEAKEHFG